MRRTRPLRFELMNAESAQTDVRRPKLIPLIAGPTAGGKSDLAIALAQRLRGAGIGAELVSADAYQVYRGLDIGTAKPTVEERCGIPHHVIDVADPRDRFTVSDWLNAANNAIADIEHRGGVPIVVGGTHLYVKNLIDGMFEGPGADAELRGALEALGAVALRAELERVDPEAAARIHPNDTRRTVRAIEVFRLTGRPISDHQQQWRENNPTAADAGRFRLVTLDWTSERINPRINSRVRTMMERGLLEEVRGLMASGAFEGEHNQAREALGYKQLLQHLNGRMSLDEAVERIKIETRQFAKSQRTWLKRLRIVPGTLTLDAARNDVSVWPEMVMAGWA